MNVVMWIRRAHRWLSIVFTLVVAVDTVAVAMGAYADWLGLLAVAPLLLLLASGLYLFALPYVTRWRSVRRTVGQA